MIATAAIQTIENGYYGIEARIYEHRLGYAVSLFDSDAEQKVGTRIYPTLEGAQEYARKLTA